MGIIAYETDTTFCIFSTTDDAEDEDDTRSSSDDDVNLETFQHKSFQP